MSEGTTQWISISDLATTLRASITEDQQLTLNTSTLGDQLSTAYLLGALNVEALTLAAAQVSDIEGGLRVTGTASFLHVNDLAVTLTVTAPDGGVGLSLRATSSGGSALQLPGFSSLTVGQVAVALDVTLTENTQSITGALSGTVRLSDIDVPISIRLPASPVGLQIKSAFGESAGPSPLALAGLVPGLDLASSLPAGLGDLLRVREFELVTGQRPYIAFTLGSTQPWELIPETLRIENVELGIEALKATEYNPLHIGVRLKAILRMGTNSMPIVMSKAESSGSSAGEWNLHLDNLEVPLSGLAALAGLFGGTDQLESIMPGLGNFGGLALKSLHMSVDPARRLLSSLSFVAAAQDEWTLPLFGGVSFGRPILALGIQGLGLQSPPPDGAPVPFLAFRLTSAKSWALIPEALTLENVELFVGVTLATANSTRNVQISVGAGLRLGTLLVPITLATGASTSEWVLSMGGSGFPLPGLADLAQFFGGAEQLESMMPGLGNFGALLLTSLEMRINAAQHKISSLSFSAIARKDWKLPLFGELALRRTTVALKIDSPLSSTRAVTGTVSAEVKIAGREFWLDARKDSPTAAWRLVGQQAIAQPLALKALASDFLADVLPDGIPEISFVDTEVALPLGSGEFSLKGRSPAPWKVPLAGTELALSNVRLAIDRSMVNGAKKVTLAVNGDLVIGSVTVSLGLKLPGGASISTDLPAFKLSEILNALGGGTVLSGLGLPDSFFDLALGPSNLTIDAINKIVVLSGSAAGFGALEFQLRRDSRGKMGAALALKPQAGVNLETLLGVPGLGTFQLADLVFVLSSIHEPTLHFANAAFASIGPVTRGFGFSAKIDIAPLGVGIIPGLPTAPIAVQAHFGRTLAEFTLAAALCAPGGRFLLDPASGLCLIDPELRISPATAEVGVAGRIELILDGQKLNFTGGFKLSNGAAALFATMQGDWNHPCGISGVVARDLSLQLNIPGLPALSGTLQMGRTTGALTIKPDPAAPVLAMQIDHLDLHDLISSVCDPALANVPAEYRQLIADIRIANARIYVAPRDTTIGNTPCPAGVSVSGKMLAWGLEIDADVKTLGSGPLKSLSGTGSVRLPDLGGLLVLADSIDKNGVARGNPSFQLALKPGEPPLVRIAAAVRVLGVTTGSVDISLNDAGFKLAVSGNLLGGPLKATLNISGGRLGSNTRYAVAAELDSSAFEALLEQAKAKLSRFAEDAKGEIARAESLLADVDRKAAALTQEQEERRKSIQAARDKDAADLRQAESEVQTQLACVAALSSSAEKARATVLAERAEVDRRIGVAQRDVAAAARSVSALTSEINATNRWFYSLPKVAVPWEASQAREGAWFGIKMGGLYSARAAAQTGLDIAQRALQAVTDAQHSFSVDIDPRVAGTVAALATAEAALATAQASLATLRATIQLIPIDADFRMVALAGLQQAQTVQRVAAQSARDLAERALDGIAKLGASLAPEVKINRAYFSGELSALQNGKVQLGVDVTTPAGSSSFAVGLNLNDVHTLSDLESAAVELVNRLLATDTVKALAAVAQSTSTAANTIVQVEQQVLPTNAIVTLRSGETGQFLRVMGQNPLRYGDTISLRTGNGHYLVAASNGVVNADRSAIGTWERWILQNPSDLNSTDFVRYGDTIALRSCLNLYLRGNASSTLYADRDNIGATEGWVLLHPDDVNRRDEVDTSQKVALRSWANTLLGAWDGGGGGAFAWNPTCGAWESWSLVVPSSAALSYCVDARGASSSDPTCQFQVERCGDWIGFRSQRSNLFLSVAANQPACANSPNFADPGHAAEHFRVEGSALYNQSTAQYLHFSGTAANAPRFVDGAGTVRSDLKNTFVIAIVAVSNQITSAISSGREPTANDLATSLQQKDAVSGVTAAAVGPSAERSAAAQATQTGQGGVDRVEPARLALAQAEADRRARRERTIEKAARGPREVMAAWRDGALYFDGQAYLQAPARRAVLAEAGGTAEVKTIPILALGAQFTIEAWVCPESFASEVSPILCKWNDNDEDEILFSLTNQGRLSLSWHVDGASSRGYPGFASCQSDEAVKLDAWSHIAAVRDGDAVSLYVDGRRVGGAVGLGSAPLRVGSCNWQIGAQPGSGPHNFVGLIDSIRIWDEAHSASSLRAQRFLVCSGGEAKLLACWNFDEVGGDIAFDAGPNALHARLVGTVQRTAQGAPQGPPLPDRHLTLTGGAHAVVGEVDLFAGSTAMTIEAWVRLDRIAEEFVAILSKWGHNRGDEFLFGLGASGKPIFGWRTQGGTVYGTPGWNQVYGDRAVPLGRWCHVSVVRDGKTIRFYCDGEPAGASNSADELPLRRGPVPVCIGSGMGLTHCLEGSLAELRVFSRAVSAEELRGHYRRPFAGDEPGLTALWHLDEVAGSLVRDGTSGGHHGTLGGPVSWPARGGPPRLVGPTQGMQFGGAQHIEFGDADDSTPDLALTIESWICVNSITEDYSSIVNKWKAVNEYLFGLMPDQRLVFTWRTQGSGGWGTPSFSQVFSSAPIKLHRFTHVAVVRAGTTVSFFIDGQLAGSSDVVELLPFVNIAAPLHIGGESGGAPRYLRGTIAGLRIWRVARTAEQIAASMAGLVSSREPGRILDLRFDEGDGTTVLDSATGRLGSVQGTPPPPFVKVTLPVRQPLVNNPDPTDIWLQPALDAARHCQTTGVESAAAIVDVEATLQQLGSSTHAQVTALLAKAGYAPQNLAAALVGVWGHDDAEVAQQYFQAGRPATEALAAIDAALVLTRTEGSSHSRAISLASAAGYTPESLGAALFDLWGHDALAVAQLYSAAENVSADAACAVWATIGRYCLPCFAALCKVLLAADYPQSTITAALRDHFGCDESSIAHALRRAGDDATIVHPPVYATPAPQLGLRAYNGQYVHLAGSGSNAADVVAKSISVDETDFLILCDLGQNRVALKTSAGKYVTCTEGSALVAMADEIGPAETFERWDLRAMHPLVEAGVIALKANNGAFVCVESDSGRRLLANRDAVEAGETFAVVNLPESITPTPPVEPPPPPPIVLGSAKSRLLDLSLVGAVLPSQPDVSDSAASPALLIPGNFSGTSSRTQVLVYDAPLGTWCVYRWDPSLGFVALGASQGGWRTGGQIIPIMVAGSSQTHVLFYDPTRGEGQVFRWNAAMNSMESVGPLMTGWSTTLKIIPGNFVNPGASQLMFYDFAAGEATVNGFDPATGLGSLGPVRPGWRRTWQIVPLQLPGYANTCFLLYDPTAGDAMVYRWLTTGGEEPMGPLWSGWHRTWSIIPAHNAQDGATLFHDTATGNLFCFKFSYPGGALAFQDGWTREGGNTTCGPATLGGPALVIHPVQIIPGDFGGTGREFYIYLPVTSI